MENIASWIETGGALALLGLVLYGVWQFILKLLEHKKAGDDARAELMKFLAEAAVRRGKEGDT